MADEEIIKVRIPELSNYVDPLSPDDMLLYWNASLNKTRKLPLSVAAAYFAGDGSGTSISPTVNGATFIHFVTAGEAGGTTVSIPAIAGQQFTLSRDGIPLELGNDSSPKEYSILDAGGFKITISGDKLVEGQRFFGQIFTLAGGVPITGGTSGGSFITGKVVVTTNLPMTVADHINKMMQIRSGAGAGVTVTLPDLDDIPAGTIIPFEAQITNAKQSTIKTQGGQNIYFNNGSAPQVYIGPGENLWLFRDDDGFYLITKYPDTGKISPSFKVGIDELLCDGSYKNRADYPRLWAWAQGTGSSLVSDALRNTASATVVGKNVPKPYRGCFGVGDGTTTFQLPDLMNQAIRGLLNDGGSDTQRYYNHAGGAQENEVGSFDLKLTGIVLAKSGNSNQVVAMKNISDADLGTAEVDFGTVGSGSESRMDNVGMLWTVKI